MLPGRADGWHAELGANNSDTGAARPRPGTILETPGTGGSPIAPVQPNRPRNGAELAARPSNGSRWSQCSVASDTIRRLSGIAPGDAYNPDAHPPNFSNLWQTGLFDDIKIEAERGDTGVVVAPSSRSVPRISSVEYRGNKELNARRSASAGARQDRSPRRQHHRADAGPPRRRVDQDALREGGFEGVHVDALTETSASR
jgi:hypothetical protein